jgi:hypothetical protein
MVLTVGQRVMTKLGPGTILGFERFAASGKSAPLSDIDSGSNRICCRLDQPENWLLHEKGGDPYFVRSDLGDLKE